MIAFTENDQRHIPTFPIPHMVLYYLPDYAPIVLYLTG